MDCCAKPTRLPAGPFCFPQQSVLLVLAVAGRGSVSNHHASIICACGRDQWFPLRVIAYVHECFLPLDSCSVGMVVPLFFSPTNDLILLLPQPFYLVLAAALPTVGLVRRTQRYVTTAAASMGGGPNIAWCCSSNTLILPNKIPIVK